MYENYKQPMLTQRDFIVRLGRHALVSVGLLLLSLFSGIAGYMAFGHLKLVDAFLNASMILAGMGPVDQLSDDGGKLFAGFYALYSGVVFLVIVGVVVAPVVHRLLHRLHVEPDDREPIGDISTPTEITPSG